MLYFREFGTEETMTPQASETIKLVNNASDSLNSWVANETARLVNDGKIVGIVGGEHSVPLGYMQTLATKYADYGILQIDAHADLRDAYEGFTCSHASIMFNALKIPQISKLVQVGIRDYCTQEAELINSEPDRIKLYSDPYIKNALYNGKHWREVCDEIVADLPENIYISYDIDGLQPWLCPNTGTPVPGGFQVEEITYLIERAIDAGKKIIGFDLCEVAPGEDEWDGNVGSRVLYKLCLLALKSRMIH
jgi:agmatinase